MSTYKNYVAVFMVTGALIVSLQAMTGNGLTGAAPHETMVICHTPPDPDITIDIPEHVLDAHLKHGDFTGPCPDSSSAASSSESDAGSAGSQISSDSSGPSSGMSSSSESTSSGEPASSSSSRADNETPTTSGPAPVEQPQSGGGGGGGGGSETIFAPILRGHGLAEHASALDFVLSNYDLQPQSVYSFGDEQRTPTPILTVDTTGRTVRIHAAICSMYRYFKQLLITRPRTPDDYIDWVAAKMAGAIGEDPAHMKEALLGRPHAHADHEDLHLQNIGEQGCAASAYVYEGATGAREGTPAPVAHIHLDQSHLMETITPPETLRVDDRSTDTQIDFSVLRRNDLFTDYGNSLSKEMHLIIVRDDLQYFHHVHPDRDAFGMWHIPFMPDAGGTYWLYANFSERDGHSYALRFSRTYPDVATSTGTGTTVDPATEKTVDGYHVRMIPAQTDSGMSFTYQIRDAEGKRVRPEHFMGAFGHSVLLSTKGAFVHSHPSLRADDDPVFHVGTLPAGTYRIFTQFVIDKKEYTFVFDWVR